MSGQRLPEHGFLAQQQQQQQQEGEQMSADKGQPSSAGKPSKQDGERGCSREHGLCREGLAENFHSHRLEVGTSINMSAVSGDGATGVRTVVAKAAAQQLWQQRDEARGLGLFACGIPKWWCPR